MVETRIKLLLVEDSPLEAVVVKDMLAKASSIYFDVSIAASLKDMGSALERAVFDVILLDLTLPDSQGLNTFYCARRMAKGALIIILTMVDDDKVIMDCLRDGAQDYLVKGQFNQYMLVRAINYARQRSRMFGEIEDKTRALKASEQRFRNIVEKSDVGIVILDKNRVVCFVNNAAAQLINRPSQEMLNKDFEFLVQPDGALDVEVVRDSGELTVLQMSMTSTEWEDGQAYLVMIHDISQLKKLDNLKDEFISTVSHELRTPLTTIKELVSQVLDGVHGEINPDQRKYLNLCADDVIRLKHIIDDLLDISRIESGRIDVRKERVDVAGMIKRLSIAFSSQAVKKGLQIKTRIEKEPQYAYADEVKIYQVFTNLIGNSLKFTESGRIELSVCEKGDFLECAVADTGAGIAAENLPRVFDKFQQFCRDAVAQDKGVGLGLSIARSIVNMHGGQISVQSHLDSGSKFIFTLPRYAAEYVIHENVVKQAMAGEKERKEFSVFLTRFNNAKDIPGDVFSGFVDGLRAIVHAGDFVDLTAENDVVVVSDVSKDNAWRVAEALRRKVKEIVLGSGAVLSFSYGWASYPADGADAAALMKKAGQSLADETMQRLAKSILIVDDEEKILKSLKALLKRDGYENVREAGGGEEALKKVKESRPGLIILDMRMPGMNGYEVIGHLKEDAATSDIPVLIMSAYHVEDEELEKYGGRKTIPMINKPFEEEQLKRLVDYLL